MAQKRVVSIMYCKRCDKEGVTNWHPCFHGSNAIISLESKKKLNTPLARKMAKLYEHYTGYKFPGGITNAKIYSNRGMGSYAASEGTWSWYLMSIDESFGYPYNFGSCDTATHCSKQSYDDMSILNYNGDFELVCDK